MKIFFWKSHPLRKHLIFLSFFRKKLKSEYSDYINAPLVKVIKNNFNKVDAEL